MVEGNGGYDERALKNDLVSTKTSRRHHSDQRKLTANEVDVLQRQSLRASRTPPQHEQDYIPKLVHQRRHDGHQRTLTADEFDHFQRQSLHASRTPPHHQEDYIPELLYQRRLKLSTSEPRGKTHAAELDVAHHKGPAADQRMYLRGNVQSMRTPDLRNRSGGIITSAKNGQRALQSPSDSEGAPSTRANFVVRGLRTIEKSSADEQKQRATPGAGLLAQAQRYLPRKSKK